MYSWGCWGGRGEKTFKRFFSTKPAISETFSLHRQPAQQLQVDHAVCIYRKKSATHLVPSRKKTNFLLLSNHIEKLLSIFNFTVNCKLSSSFSFTPSLIPEHLTFRSRWWCFCGAEGDSVWVRPMTSIITSKDTKLVVCHLCKPVHLVRVGRTRVDCLKAVESFIFLLLIANYTCGDTKRLLIRFFF